MIARGRYEVGLLAGIAVAVAGVLACGSPSKPAPQEPGYELLAKPSTREPADEIERAVLAQLPQLAPGAEATIQGQPVIVGAPYAAASGRTCRAVAIGKPERSRLACRIGQAWTFVPNSVRSPAGEAP